MAFRPLVPNPNPTTPAAPASPVQTPALQKAASGLQPALSGLSQRGPQMGMGPTPPLDAQLLSQDSAIQGKATDSHNIMYGSWYN